MPDTHKNYCPAAKQGLPSAHYGQYQRSANSLLPGPPMYRVIPAGKAFYHVVETASDRVIGYRRQHADACALARELEALRADELPAIQANSDA